MVSDLTTAYNAQSLPTTATNTTGETITYAHDKLGDLLSADSSINANDWAYTYDAYGRLACAKQATTCTSGATRVLFVYDALDRALNRTYNAQTSNYTYRGASETIAKIQVGTGTPTTYAYTAGGSPLGEKTGTTASFDLTDPHGDVVGLVSTAAANQGTSAYDPYGKPLAVSGSTSLLGYQGDLTDAITKQVDMGTRWYTPGMGRFSTRDVVPGDVQSPMSLNQWAYGAMNPVTMSDPTGMRPYCDDCSDTENQHLAQDYSTNQQTYGPGSQYWYAHNPAPPPPVPPPPIIYAGKFASMMDIGVCGHSCGDGSYAKGWEAQDNATWDEYETSGDDGGGGACSGFWGCLGHGLTVGWRAAVNAPVTLLGVAWATVTGGDCDWEVELTIACYGGADWADGSRGGFTAGNVFITHYTQAELDKGAASLGTTRERILQHERRHSTQWAVFGPGMPFLYGADLLQSGGNPCNQVLEVDAGLDDGGYGLQC